MSKHLDMEGLRALLAGDLAANAESAFLAHLKEEPECTLCEALFESLDDGEESELLERLSRTENARDPGDAWQAQGLNSGGGRGKLRWILAGALGSLVLLLLIVVGGSRLFLAPEPEDGQRIKGPEAAKASVLRLRAGIIPEGHSQAVALEADRPVDARGQLVFFVEVDAACRLWIVRLGPDGADGLVGYEGTLWIRLDAGESLLRQGDRALGLDLSDLAGDQEFLAGCGPAPAPESLRKAPEGVSSLRLEVKAP